MTGSLTFAPSSFDRRFAASGEIVEVAKYCSQPRGEPASHGCDDQAATGDRGDQAADDSAHVVPEGLGGHVTEENACGPAECQRCADEAHDHTVARRHVLRGPSVRVGHLPT